MRVPVAFARFPVPVLTMASCTADDEVTAGVLVVKAQEIPVPTLPCELVPGVRLNGSIADGNRLDLILLPAAERAVLFEELAPPVCAIEATRSLVSAGGTLRFTIGAREIGTVTTCPET